MAAQIPDVFMYKARGFHIAGIDGPSLFHPEKHGLEPNGRTPICWRGYVCFYYIDDDGYLALKGLGAFNEKEPPPVFGVKPQLTEEAKNKKIGFDYSYEKVDTKLPLTGGLLIGDGIEREYVSPAGFHPAWKYKEVYELRYENGKIISETERSKEMGAIRRGMTRFPKRDRPKKDFSCEYGNYRIMNEDATWF